MDDQEIIIESEKPDIRPKDDTVLVLGIVALAIAVFTGGIFALASFILSLICLGKVKTYRSSGAENTTKISVGLGLSVAALVLSSIVLA